VKPAATLGLVEEDGDVGLFNRRAPMPPGQSAADDEDQEGDPAEKRALWRRRRRWVRGDFGVQAIPSVAGNGPAASTARKIRITMNANEKGER
jgi:hypothetical protein